MNPVPLTLSGRVRSLLTEAVHAYQGRPAQQRLATVARQLDGPLRVAIAGRVKAGKSTLLNALVGSKVAPTDAGECTRVVTWYAYGSTATATAFPRGGKPLETTINYDGGRWELDLDNCGADELDRIEVTLPVEWLRQMILVDTPGMGSLTESAGERTQGFLGESGNVDAVLYLLRHLHSSDVDFLDAFHEAGSSDSTPVNAVGVLSRADEVGGGGPDALRHAARVAAAYRTDPRIHSLVHTVLPVAGLLAETAATLSEGDFADLAGLAKAGEAATTPLLLSATRFVARTRSTDVSPETRRRLLQMLGIYGIRLCLDLIRSGSGDTEELRVALQERSGLSELRRLLLTQFAQRRDVLKADGALRVIESVVHDDPIPAAPRLRQAVERLRISAHELTEIKLLTDLRFGVIHASPEQLAIMERLLGGQGASVSTRLGLPPDSAAQTIRAVIIDMHQRWRKVAQNPLTDPAMARAAQVLQRTCEGLSAAIQNQAGRSRPAPTDQALASGEKTVVIEAAPRPRPPSGQT